jgi:hypothetical protein
LATHYAVRDRQNGPALHDFLLQVQLLD